MIGRVAKPMSLSYPYSLVDIWKSQLYNKNKSPCERLNHVLEEK